MRPQHCSASEDKGFKCTILLLEVLRPQEHALLPGHAVGPGHERSIPLHRPFGPRRFDSRRADRLPASMRVGSGGRKRGLDAIYLQCQLGWTAGGKRRGCPPLRPVDIAEQYGDTQ